MVCRNLSHFQHGGISQFPAVSVWECAPPRQRTWNLPWVKESGLFGHWVPVLKQPGTCLSFIFSLDPSKTRSFPIKTRVNWVPGKFSSLDLNWVLFSMMTFSTWHLTGYLQLHQVLKLARNCCPCCPVIGDPSCRTEFSHATHRVNLVPLRQLNCSQLFLSGQPSRLYQGRQIFFGGGSSAARWCF